MRPLLIAALILFPAQAAKLRITVYDQAHLGKQVSEAAFDSLRQILHESGLEIELVTGDPSSREASLLTYPGAPRRGNEQEAACRARTDVAMEIVAVSPPSLKYTILGTAQPLAWEGLNVRVFDDHVRDAATRQGCDHAAVLAHAIAHEIGHVLLRSGSHSSSGLMAASWTNLEYGWIARNVMFFTGDQSKAMRAVLSEAGCPHTPTLTRSAGSRRIQQSR